MKKLMITAAAVALSATSFGKLCDVEAIDECSVYNVKFTFKTLAAKNKCNQGAKWLVRVANAGQSVWYRTDEREDLAAEQVADLLNRKTVMPVDYLLGQFLDPYRAPNVVTGASRREVYWMDNATRKFEGIIWQCQAACFEGAAPWSDVDVNLERINFAMWEKKANLALTFPIMQAKIGKPENDASGFVNNEFRTVYFSFNEELNFGFLGRYGNKAQKVAAYWTPRLRRGRIQAAGFGSFDAKNLRVKSISGNAVGMIAPITAGFDECGDPDSFFCAVGFMCAQWLDWCCDGCYAGVQFVPASGTWSLKYNASATKKANSDKLVLTDLVPNYMMYSTAAEWNRQRALDPNLHESDKCYWIAVEDSADATILEGSLFYKSGKTDKGITLSVGEILNNVAEQNALVFDIYDNATFTKITDAGDNSIYGYVIGKVEIPGEIADDGTYTTKKVWKYYKADSKGVLAVQEETMPIYDEESEGEEETIIGYKYKAGDLIVGYVDEIYYPVPTEN